MSAFISLLHTVAAAVAVPLGAFVLFGKKGSFLHKKLGRYYFISMLLANTSSLFIYKAFGEWFFPHSLAVLTLLFLFLGYGVLLRKSFRYRLSLHLTGMTVSYYLLIGGGINEAFLHIPMLKPYLTSGPVLGITHFIALLFFGILIFRFLQKHRSFGENKLH